MNIKQLLQPFQQKLPESIIYRFIYAAMCLTALIIYLTQKSNIQLPSLINNYINDFLCLPILLGGMSFIIKKLKKDNSFKLPLIFVTLLASYYSFYFEYYLPKSNPRYTADWIDVLLYFSGGLTYYLFSEKNTLILKK